MRLARLNHIQHTPHVALLFDQYDEDWTQLWSGPDAAPAAIRELELNPLEMIASHFKANALR